MKLHDIPAGSKLMVRVVGDPSKRHATFHHLDGMYSLCRLDDVSSSGAYAPTIFHLHHDEEMVAVGDPITHYELAGDQSDKPADTVMKGA